ncbi:MAG TPA: hypothetical protein VGZ32_26540 [Actinocrinis sp.]|jgi:hypothetical protein|uniref:hypothetical protein n=1 Tax=Actinocrinis sp. TaxID=1920516 RepID=UPI002DDD0D98|nr:hypothetical protein [Actinocrinis sp.]HEV3173938.1 hypothetical protein [Actinocrinis sp.]
MAVEADAPESGAPDEADRTSGVRLWFRALWRSLIAIVATLAVLAVLGFGADVVLHRVTHASHSSSTYTGVSAVEILLDGDGSVSLTGLPRSGNGAAGAQPVSLVETDTSTMFDHPQRTIDRIGGTLYIAVQCPDSLCSADLGVTVPAATPVTLRVGNALRLDRANVTVSGMSGPIELTAWPAKVTITDSTSTIVGEVAGSIRCAAPSICIVQLIG